MNPFPSIILFLYFFKLNWIYISTCVCLLILKCFYIDISLINKLIEAKNKQKRMPLKLVIWNEIVLLCRWTLNWSLWWSARRRRGRSWWTGGRWCPRRSTSKRTPEPTPRSTRLHPSALSFRVSPSFHFWIACARRNLFVVVSFSLFYREW